MNEWALAYLRAVTHPTTAPAPASLRHTVPPAPSVSMAAPEFGCVGLCIGGTCERCDTLAHQIGEDRLITNITRLCAREAELTQQINALREGLR